MRKFTGGQIVGLFRDGGRRPLNALSHRVHECDLSTLTVTNWCSILAIRPDLVHEFEKSTHNWNDDEKELMSAGTEVEMISAEEFFKDEK